MSLATTKIANCPTYQFINGSGKLDTYIFFPGIGELANGVNGKAKGLAALKMHGQPKFFTATWPNIQIIAVQLPNDKRDGALFDKIVAEVKALPNTGDLFAAGLSMGAMLHAWYFCSDTGARAAQFKGCFLMSGNSFIGTKAKNFKNMKMVLFSGSEALDTKVSPKNYESIYPVYKKAGVDISYTLLNEGHNDNVWNHFSPLQSPAIYKGFTTIQPQPYIPPIDNPLPPIVETQNPDMAPLIIKDNAVLDGTKGNVYNCAAADITLTLPPEPKAPFNVWIRNTGKFNMHFTLPLHYNETQLQDLSTPGLYRIFFDTDTKSYWVMHNV